MFVATTARRFTGWAFALSRKIQNLHLIKNKIRSNLMGFVFVWTLLSLFFLLYRPTPGGNLRTLGLRRISLGKYVLNQSAGVSQ
jgi:hypothetical protein